jgi:DNA polymerase
MMVKPEGSLSSRIMIVGEAPGAEEVLRNAPFQGASGQELNRMLHEAGISRSECFITNVCRERPPGNDINCFIAKAKKDRTYEHQELLGKWVKKPIFDGYALLQREVNEVKPWVIIALGNTALWALTGKWGVSKWRGSMLTCAFAPSIKVIPTLHPAAVLRQWSDRAIAVQDLRRAKRNATAAPYAKPAWQFKIRPAFQDCINILDKLIAQCDAGIVTRISFDIETRSGHIACAGIAWSRTDALCIPFMVVGQPSGYWSEVEETEIVWRLSRLLTHKSCEVVGQNIIYDSQYTWKHWGFVPRVKLDTMIAQHACFSDMPKGLDFLASMYCEWYVYWKDESKDWDANLGEDQLWYYNCEDTVYTWEVAEVLLETANTLGLAEVNLYQQEMFWPVLYAMIRGVRINTEMRARLVMEVQNAYASREQFLIDVFQHPVNIRSPKQMQTLFYEDLQQKVVMTRATKNAPARPTINDEALTAIARREPLLRPIVNCIADMRTLGIFLSNFLTAGLDEDRRFRCSYNIGGSSNGKTAPKTYRMSSSENAFGRGGNLQNIPSEKSKSVNKAAQRGSNPLVAAYQLPNLRDMFIPDRGQVFFNGDLDRADLQVVVWESDDAMLKAALRMGADIHLMNAFVLEGKEPPPLEELCESHPRYPDHRLPRKGAREFAKTFCHGTNYGGSARTMAAHTGRGVQEVERAQRIWFGAHPGIKRWHDQVKDQLTRYRFVENRFGYRWYVFDRIDSIVPEAIAWVPQSTVSIVINRIWQAFYQNLPSVETLIMVHDSLAGQFPKTEVNSTVAKMHELSKIIVPYDDPLIIPFSIKTSEVSWGEA